MFIEYGCHRGFTVEELLQHEITNSTFFLVGKNGYLKESATLYFSKCKKAYPESLLPTTAMGPGYIS